MIFNCSIDVRIQNESGQSSIVPVSVTFDARDHDEAKQFFQSAIQTVIDNACLAGARMTSGGQPTGYPCKKCGTYEKIPSTSSRLGICRCGMKFGIY